MTSSKHKMFLFVGNYDVIMGGEKNKDSFPSCDYGRGSSNFV